MLDTSEAGTHAGHLCEKRLAWLSDRLQDARRDAISCTTIRSRSASGPPMC
jgi:hypothetical protein